LGLSAVGLFAASGVLADTVRVQISGLDPTLEANVRAFLSIVDLETAAADDGRAPNVDENAVRRADRTAEREIAAALQPFGYYDALIERSLRRNGDVWTAGYRIDPGPPTRIGAVNVSIDGEGREVPALRRVLSSFAVRRGEVLNHAVYNAEKERLFDTAYASGFLDAAYARAQIAVRRGERIADIELLLETGSRYFFGDIDIEQDILNESFMERFVAIRPGDPFNTDRLIDLQLALTDSGYFSSVQIQANRARVENQRIPVTVQTEPRRTQRYRFGLGYGTDTGPRISLGVELRRINRQGHRFNSDLRLSAIESTLAAEYQVPVKDVATEYVGFNASLGQEEVGDYDTLSAAVGVSLNDTWNRLKRRVYLSARRERFWIGDGPRRTEDLIYPGIDLSYTRADDPLNTRKGFSLSGDLRGGSESFGSSTSFMRFRGRANLVRPLPARSRFLFRTEVGALDVDDFSALAPSQRFFTGGDASVRGYGYEELGPTTPEGAVIGGRYLFVGSIEFDHLFRNNFGVAIFADAGNAADEADMDLSRGVGIGLRWQSPVGMVRVDLAHPLDDPDTDYRIHLSVGPNL
jgi:translocation and assembly module TamA